MPRASPSASPRARGACDWATTARWAPWPAEIGLIWMASPLFNPLGETFCTATASSLPTVLAIAAAVAPSEAKPRSR